MNAQTNNVATNSETLASAMDVINLHPDRQDVMNVNNEIDDATEVIANSHQPSNGIYLSCKLQDILLNQEETQHQRAPRPLFMGPTKKNRRARGGRKSTNKSANDQSKQTEIPNVDAPTQSVEHVERHTDVTNNWTTSKNDNQTGTQQPIQFSENTAPNNSKRMRSAQPSPNNSNISDSGKPSNPKKQKTFAEVVADDLKLLICNEPSGITSEQLMKFEVSLMLELDNYLANTPTPASMPTFHTSSFYNGTMKLICVDNFSAEWIKQTVSHMPPPWEGAKLIVKAVEPPNRQPQVPNRRNGPMVRTRAPRRPTVRFFIPSGVKKPTFEEVVKRIKAQNHPLDTSNWIAWKAEEKPDGMFYHVSVDEPNVNFIKAKDSRLFYCFSKIRICLPKESKGTDSQEGNEMETVENGDTQ